MEPLTSAFEPPPLDDAKEDEKAEESESEEENEKGDEGAVAEKTTTRTLPIPQIQLPDDDDTG